jgi:signal transduction histidine kinase
VKLRTRLALVSALVLSLPLAGWQLVQSLEQSLRDSYQQALIDTARSIADEVSHALPETAHGGALFVHEASSQLVVDGYASDWTAWLDEAQAVGGASEDRESVRVVAAERRGRLYLLIQVADSRLVLARPDAAPGDRVVLRVGDGDRTDELVIAPMAPGWLNARGSENRLRAQAAMQPTERGWTLEIAVEEPLAVSTLGLQVVDVDERGSENATTIGDAATRRPLLRSSPSLSQRLEALLPEGTRGWVTDPDGWIIARANREENAARGPADRDRWLFATAAARMLGVLPKESPIRDPARDRLDARELSATPRADWYQLPSGSGFVVSAGVPMLRDDHTRGHVVVERPADRFMARAYRSLLQLFVFGLAGMLISAAVLIGFAGWLSTRIRRLRDAAESAVGGDGRVHGLLSAPAGRDEIGDLGRSLANMVERQRQHQDYLQTLAGKLSHELRTPLAMIRTSLDNLSEVEDAEARERYRSRAEAGCLRLQKTFQAMSQAARVEESLTDEPLESLDLGQLVEHYAAGCRQTFEQHRFAAIVPGPGTARISGSGEQIAQLLDKLVDNAIEFAPVGSRITLRVVPQGRDVSLQVDNPGPGLPEGESERLFESMVSSREVGEERVHLGLGLYIVRLIARRHGGRVRALDRPGGVRFQVDFPRLAE